MFLVDGDLIAFVCQTFFGMIRTSTRQPYTCVLGVGMVCKRTLTRDTNIAVTQYMFFQTRICLKSQSTPSASM